MAATNKIIISGFIFSDELKITETKRTDNGEPLTVVKFALGQSKGRNAGCEYFNICAIDVIAKSLISHKVKKSDKLLVTGRLCQKCYKNKSGKNTYYYEILAQEIEYLKLASYEDGSIETDNGNKTIANVLDENNFDDFIPW